MTFRSLITAFALTMFVGLAAPSQAQTLVDTTTLSSAITSTTQNTISLTAVTCTGCTFGQDAIIFVDREAMRVTGQYAAGSGTLTVNVRRGTDGTIAASHASGVRLYYGPPNRFHLAVGGGGPNLGDPTGTCTRGQAGGLDRGATILPWINIANGNIWVCDGTWYGSNSARLGYNSLITSGNQ